jgi:hypothetical protein
VVGQPESVGLGLTVSRTLAELMGGSLTYRYDERSVFRLELPLAVTNGAEGWTPKGTQADEVVRAMRTVGSARISVN